MAVNLVPIIVIVLLIAAGAAFYLGYIPGAENIPVIGEYAGAGASMVGGTAPAAAAPVLIEVPSRPVFKRDPSGYCRGAGWRNVGHPGYVKPAECEAACVANKECRGFDMMRPNAQGQYDCWLSSADKYQTMADSGAGPEGGCFYLPAYAP